MRYVWKRFEERQLTWLARLILVLAVFAGAGAAFASVPDGNSAASLHAKHAALAGRLHDNPFKRALYLDSSETPGSLKGDVYTLVDYPMATVGAALDDPGHWCEVLILHINTKLCRAAADRNGSVLTVSVGSKTAQPLEDAYPIEFAFRAASVTPQYLEIRLDAKKGPMSTSNYRILLQAVPVGKGQTFMRLTYSYDYGLAARLAMKSYLATIGSSKVGFTPVGRQSNGQPEYIGGMRGVVERNTMRYYLAIDSYLASLSSPPPLQLQKRLQSWYAATEQYPRQLHEIGRTAYMDMKQSEYLRQQASY
jgi:hypothetical protein